MQEKTIIDEWDNIKFPQAPEIKSVKIIPNESAFLILDIQKQNCNSETRPRCEVSVPRIKSLLERARNNKMNVIYSLTNNAEISDIREEVAPITGEPIVKSSVDKFFNTELEKILKDKNIKNLVISGTSAHGAILHTGTAAALRGFNVIIPVDCISANEPYAEQYTCWHLINAPGSKKNTILTLSTLIEF